MEILFVCSNLLIIYLIDWLIDWRRNGNILAMYRMSLGEGRFQCLLQRTAILKIVEFIGTLKQCNVISKTSLDSHLQHKTQLMYVTQALSTVQTPESLTPNTGMSACWFQSLIPLIPMFRYMQYIVSKHPADSLFDKHNK